MKIADILRALADVVDLAHDDLPDADIADQSVEVVTQEPEPEELDRLTKLAGISKASTTPCEEVFPVQSVVPAGNDLHYSKNPADMRTDSISLYPGYGAKD